MSTTRSRAVPLRAAVSSLAVPTVSGPVRRATVVASTRHGAYLLLDGGTEVLPLLTSDALALPTAVRLAVRSTGRSLGLDVGEIVHVGRCRIVAAGFEVVTVRTVRPARVRSVPGGAPHTPLREGEVLALLGRGPGLTPEGDDELAGRLLVTVAAGGAVPDLDPHLHRTTALSASLLRAAAQGYAVPEVVAYVDAVVGRHHVAARRLRPAVAAIGHTSGAALLRGVAAALPAPEMSPPPLERTVA